MPSLDSVQVEPKSVERYMPLWVAAKTTPGTNSVMLQTVSERTMPLPGAGGFQVAPPSVDL